MTFSISIVTHSALKLAKQCILSVLTNSRGHDYEVILTANGNPEAAIAFEEVGFLFKHCVVIKNPANMGFITPNNYALTQAKGKYFITLNDDATVPEGWLDKLEAPFLADPDCAISGPRGGCCSLDENFIGFPGKRLEYIEGSCMMILSEYAREFGLFSTYLDFAYCEDADLSLRMRQLGFTIHYADFRLASHAHGATAATVPGIGQIIAKNAATCREWWAEYLASKDRLFPLERERVT